MPIHTNRHSMKSVGKMGVSCLALSISLWQKTSNYINLMSLSTFHCTVPYVSYTYIHSMQWTVT